MIRDIFTAALSNAIQAIKRGDSREAEEILTVMLEELSGANDPGNYTPSEAREQFTEIHKD